MHQLESTAGAAVAADQHQYLTFKLADEEYGIPILRVQEIKGWTPVTPIPNSPRWLQGVMNLRGTVVPVIDLRLKFGLPAAEHTRFTVVVVVTVGTRIVGLVVDAVSDVLDVPEDDIVPPPSLGRSVDTAMLTGMAKTAERIISLLALEPIVGVDAAEAALAG